MSLNPAAFYLPSILISELLRHATSSERPVVESLAVAAGILWRCSRVSCKAVTAVDPYSPTGGKCHRCGDWQ